MNKLATAMASGLVVFASAGADARVIFSHLPALEGKAVFAARSILGEIPDQIWVMANGAKTAQACAPYQDGQVFTSDAAAFAAMLEVPTGFRPGEVRFARLFEVAQIAARTTVLSAPVEAEHDEAFSAAQLSRSTAVLGEQVFGRELSSSMQIAY